jgi:hypothetical protein
MASTSYTTVRIDTHLDGTIILAVLNRANAATQVAMSMTCTTWAQVANFYSSKYKTMSKAVEADSSIAISRILREGAMMGGCLSPKKLPNARDLCMRGTSRAFARHVSPKLNTIVPWLRVSKVGAEYAEWLETSGYNNLRGTNQYRSLALGCRTTIALCKKARGRNSSYALVLYANGYQDLCWDINDAERGNILANHEYIPRDTMVGLVSQLRVISYFQLDLFRYMTVDMIESKRCDFQDHGHFYHHYLVVCDTEEQYYALAANYPAVPCCVRNRPIYNGVATKQLTWSLFKKTLDPNALNYLRQPTNFAATFDPDRIPEIVEGIKALGHDAKCIVGHVFDVQVNSTHD